MNVRIEDSNGTVLFTSDFSDDAVMNPSAIIAEFLGSDVETEEVSWQEEVTGCYDYRIVFFDDLDNAESIAASGGFVTVPEYA